MKVTYTDVQPVIEALKEGGRIVLIAVIPVLITSLETGLVDWKAIAVVGAIALLRSIDKLLHLEGKIEDNKLLTGGLTRF